MPPRLTKAGQWLHRRAENILALMLATMFFTFILQIIFRYVINLPLGWTHELSAFMWVWLVLFGSAFVVRESEEIRFDVIYGATKGRVRRTFTLVTGLTLLALFVYSLPAMWDYVTFMKVEKTAYLDVRFDYLYSIYIVFAVAMIMRYFYLSWQAVFGESADEEPSAHDADTHI